MKSSRVFADLGEVGGGGGDLGGGWVERSGWWEKGGGGGERVTDDLGDIVYSRFFIFL